MLLFFYFRFFGSPGFAIKVLRLSRVCDQGSSALFGSAVKVLRLSGFAIKVLRLFSILQSKFFGSFDSAVKVLHI
ncbi:uncharacterized protein OCT59_004083 [Rhizophagus irregularis]|uniref:uncharacterized protein n=1 Tax=Rhizophagus irregularis TaxID=588596 RepID=UPI0033316610|nr:hypothetical protein OCT59_004083 [Rhizophagus irregularis]